jgi:hypothetical protein
MYVAKGARSGVQLADLFLPEADTVHGRRQGRPGTTQTASEAAA